MGNPKVCTFAKKSKTKNEDPYEMQHNVAFHQGLHCLLRLKLFSGAEIYHNLENSTSPFWTKLKAFGDLFLKNLIPAELNTKKKT